MIKNYKIRLYPTKEQEENIYKHISYSRFIWNYMLDLLNKRYLNKEKRLSGYDMIRLLTPLKKEEDFKWLNDVSVSTLQIVCTDLDKAFRLMFETNANRPKFKSKKKSKLSYPVCQNRIFFSNGFIQIQKLGMVKYKSDVVFPEGKNSMKFINPRIINQNNKWVLSFSVECESQVFDLNGRMGIDLGVKELAIVSYNGKQMVFHNINKSRRVKTLKRKLVHLQRKAARKYRTNGNYEKSNAIIKTEQQIREIYYHLSKIRDNYIHQTTHQLVSLNPEIVTMEDLNVIGMMKNKHLARSIQEQYFYEFRKLMQYKCESRGIKLQFADRFYPSSKTCSCCGSIKKDLKLSDRTYKCNECGLIIDRDFNAALNLERYVG